MVKHVLVANFKRVKNVFNAIRENDILAKMKSSRKFPNLQYAIHVTISIACCHIETIT